MVTLPTNFGDIKIKLDFDKAPITAENFLNYCKNGFYDNTIFHRVIDGFMIQGGGMESGMREKATNAPIQNEANNRLSNKRGTIAMARTSDPHSATAQFFINVADNDFLVQKRCLAVKWCKNGAMPYSVKWLKAWMWLIKSRK